MKKMIILSLALAMLLAIVGCDEEEAKTKTLHCDSCGKEITVSEDSNMDESWTVFCGDCEKLVNVDDDFEK